MEAEDGVIAGLGDSKIWLEMGTTDEAEIKRLGSLVEAKGESLMDPPVSGGRHRAATENIAIFSGKARETFEKVLPVLTVLGRRILRTGPLGSTSVLMVMTNYLATVHLAALGEALMVSKQAGMDLVIKDVGIFDTLAKRHNVPV